MNQMGLNPLLALYSSIGTWQFCQTKSSPFNSGLSSVLTTLILQQNAKFSWYHSNLVLKKEIIQMPPPLSTPSAIIGGQEGRFHWQHMEY